MPAPDHSSETARRSHEFAIDGRGRGQCFSLLPCDLEDRLGQQCAVIGEGAGVCLVNDGYAFLEGVVIVDQRLARVCRRPGRALLVKGWPFFFLSFPSIFCAVRRYRFCGIFSRFRMISSFIRARFLNIFNELRVRNGNFAALEVPDGGN